MFNNFMSHVKCLVPTQCTDTLDQCVVRWAEKLSDHMTGWMS